MYSSFSRAFFFFFLVFLASFFSSSCPIGVLPLSRRLAFLGYGNFVAFGREGILGVFAQGQGVEGIPRLVRS